MGWNACLVLYPVPTSIIKLPQFVALQWPSSVLLRTVAVAISFECIIVMYLVAFKYYNPIGTARLGLFVGAPGRYVPSITLNWKSLHHLL